jgi:hypothetical protein
MESHTEAEHSPGLVAGRRTSQRARMQLGATLEGTTRAYNVLLRNLPSTGAMLEGGELLRRGRW